MGFPAVIGTIWNAVFVDPTLNSLVVLYWLVPNAGVTILLFTVIIRAATYPLTLKQLRATHRMQAIQPRINEIKRRYANDRAKQQAEQMKVMRELGVNPLGCLGPMVVQLPIWIALYWAIQMALAVSPDDLLKLASHLYPWGTIQEQIPLHARFLWLDLAAPDPYFIMAVLVGASTWVQQKQMQTPTTAGQGQMGTMMLWMFPIMLAWFTLQFPSGLALYWFASNLVGVGMQYFVMGWGGLATTFKRKEPESATVAAEAAGPQVQEGTRNGRDAAIESGARGAGDRMGGGQRKDRRRRRRRGSGRTRS